MYKLGNRHAFWGAVAGVVVIAGLSAIAVAAWRGNEASSLDPDDGRAVSVGTGDSGELERMLRDASDEAGFELKTPELPEGFIVEGLRTWPAHPSAAGDAASTFRHAELFVKGPVFGFQITQTNRAVDLVGSPKKVGGEGGAEPVFLEETEQARVYTLIAAGRSFSLAIASQHTFAEEDAVAVLRSMAR